MADLEEGRRCGKHPHPLLEGNLVVVVVFPSFY